MGLAGGSAATSRDAPVVEIPLNAVNLAFVAFSKVHGDDTGQIFVFAMTIAAARSRSASRS